MRQLDLLIQNIIDCLCIGEVTACTGVTMIRSNANTDKVLIHRCAREKYFTFGSLFAKILILDSNVSSTIEAVAEKLLIGMFSIFFKTEIRGLSSCKILMADLSALISLVRRY